MSNSNSADFVERAAYAAVALALTDMIYQTDYKVAWLLRWCRRATVAELFVHAALQVRADALQNQQYVVSEPVQGQSHVLLAQPGEFDNANLQRNVVKSFGDLCCVPSPSFVVVGQDVGRHSSPP